MDAFVENTIKEIREKVGDGKVLLALSGGVDSSVAAGLLSRAIGKQLTCVFVDHGLLRKDEGDALQSLKQNVRSSVKSSSVFSKKKQRRSEQLISSHREPSILTL